jgi:hypothetical protein
MVTEAHHRRTPSQNERHAREFMPGRATSMRKRDLC